MINKPDSPSSEDVFDLLIIGGGVMGLFTAYHASESGRRVAVLERGRVGDPATASFGRTRSYRRDYLDPTYARLADEAIGLWTSFERATGANALVRCGCLNIAKASVTPDLAGTYATLTTDVLRQLGMPVHSLAPDEVTAILTVDRPRDVGAARRLFTATGLPRLDRTLAVDPGRPLREASRV